MKFIKYSLAGLLIVGFSSCLKSKNDLAGLRDDKGTIVTSIAEQQYLNTDAQATQIGYSIFANFSFATPNEDVKFFSLHIAQPRETKLSGPLLATVTMQPMPGFDPFPAGAVTIPAQITIPESREIAFDFPVKFAVNKALLNPNAHYGAIFTVTSVNQGIVSRLDQSVSVIINYDPFYNNSRITGRYKWKTTIVDPANQYSITNNTRLMVLEESAVNRLDPFDYLAWALSASPTFRYLWSSNNQNGVNTAIFQPRYLLDATGRVTGIQNLSTAPANLTSASAQVLSPTAVTNITLDAAGTHQFVYTNSGERLMTVSYSFDLTTLINGVSQTRRVQVKDEFTYHNIQAFF